MRRYTIIILFILFVMNNISYTQNLSSHRWEDRLVLVLSHDVSNETYQKQLKELYEDQEGLDDRKIVVYTILPDRYKSDESEHKEWEESGDLYKTYKKGNEAFQIVLIGLDGSVKLRQNQFISREELFERIDRMPMRKAELERREENGEG